MSRLILPYTVKVRKLQSLCLVLANLKFEKCDFNLQIIKCDLMHPEDADRMANSVGPDQTALASGSSPFDPNMSVRKLRIFTVS